MEKRQEFSMDDLNNRLSRLLKGKECSFEEAKRYVGSSLVDILEVAAYVLWEIQELENKFKELANRKQEKSGGNSTGTMGSVLKTIPDSSLSPNLKRKLKLVVDVRNYIIHQFFLDFLPTLDMSKEFLGKALQLVFEATDCVESAINKLDHKSPVQNIFDSEDS